MLSELETQNLDAALGLFRDDGLGASHLSCQQIDDIKKIICEVFRSNGLELTVDANKKRVQFLDVEFDLENITYKPYIKENDVPLYVHKNSNHPPSITKNIPDSVNRRLSALSSDEKSFSSITEKYQEALKNSAYDHKLTYRPPNQTQNRNTRPRRKGILYFNPPYSMSVKTSVGKIFLQLIDKHFPKTNPLHKIINRQKIKVSYRTTPNMKKIISSHNAKILRKSDTPQNKTCNCRNKESCPLEGKCLTDNIIYQATVTTIPPNQDQTQSDTISTQSDTPSTQGDTPPTQSDTQSTQNGTPGAQNQPPHVQTYVGLTSNTFKVRIGNHKKSFNHRKYGKETTLSRKIWELKDTGWNYHINWKILERAQPFSPITGICALCTLEKWYILFKPEFATINKRDEINNHCFHKVPVLLDNT